MSADYKPSSDILSNVGVSEEQYEAMYRGSIEQPDVFWAVQGKRLDWFKRPSKIKNTSFEGDVSIKWYEDGVLNACYNCVDRHVERGNGETTALIWEGDEPDQDARVSYAQLKDEVSRLANGLKSLGVSKGDRVIIYMPMVLEAVYAMLACARIGAVHSVVFGGFSPQSLRDRILDCDARIVMTADEGVRGGKRIPLKSNTNEAVKGTAVEDILVYKRTGADVEASVCNDVDWGELVAAQSADCPCEEMNAEDPLFILYTSGSTGKPKGVLHTTGGYMVYASLTHEVSFDYKAGEVYWCTADVGWVTGHSYIVYGPLANGGTSLVFEGVPNYPEWSRFWDVVEKHQVSVFYTAPTAIRALLREGDEFVTQTDRSSLRVLGTVGEPINVEAWEWYYNVVGDARCPVIDTWWQTETGGHMVTPLPCHSLKPGYAQKPFFGVKPALVDNDGVVLEGAAEGNFVILDSWPGQMRSIYGDHERFKQVYFGDFKGMYFTGDGARRDADGDYRITGRVDDVINVSGHRLGTAEIESAIDEYADVAEAAVIGFPHDIKGQGIYAFVILNAGVEANDALRAEIVKLVRGEIGPIATPDVVQFVEGLPKTRSGKIMRRILRKIAAGEADQIGDTSTLADPSVVDDLVRGRG
ncbi:MAG: acetate--CoA ligase [Alphaproteobacteria bacterium]